MIIYAESGKHGTANPTVGAIPAIVKGTVPIGGLKSVKQDDMMDCILESLSLPDGGTESQILKAKLKSSLEKFTNLSVQNAINNKVKKKKGNNE
jgi:hypothetical protein